MRGDRRCATTTSGSVRGDAPLRDDDERIDAR
jgi:hypothetical protein